MTSDSIAGSASGGRARSVAYLITAASPSAIVAANAAASAVVGITRLFAASQQPPAAAISGHFTHQAEARMKTAVAGPQ